MKFNRKKLMYVLPLLALTLVSAGLIAYYGQVEHNISVTQPVTINGEIEYTGTDIISNAIAGEIRRGTGILLQSSELRNPTVTDSEVDGISTRYVSDLTLTKKTVDFNKDVWEVPEGADIVEIEYTIVDNEFNAEVKNPIGGYSLIYYKDNSDRFNSPAQAILIDDIVENLPYENDKNADEYDYCETEEYDTCHGAKIWYVPTNAINGNDIDWSQANDFYFETELIQYNAEGQIIIYPNADLTITPVFNLDLMLDSGEYQVTTTIA